MTKSFFHGGNVMLAGFCCMVFFMSYLIYQCTQHPSSMISDQYYEKEMLYQQTINATGNAASYRFSAVQKRKNLTSFASTGSDTLICQSYLL